MASLTRVTDPADPRLTDYFRLRDAQLRKKFEAEHGLFIAEGVNVVRRAVGAGYPVRSLLVTESWVEAVADLLDRVAAPAYVVDRALLERVAGFHFHRGVLASMRRLPPRAVADVIRHARRLVVLEDLVDHTNIGAIFRCAAGLGMDGVILAPRCGDPLYRRVIRVSMGAVFTVPWARMRDWYGGLAELREAGFTLLALTPNAAAREIEKMPALERCALLLGSEGEGLSRRWTDQADLAVRIPMSAGIDSLNVAAAAAIACYAIRRHSAR